MKRRSVLAGIGASTAAPIFDRGPQLSEVGPVLFVQSDLTYEVDTPADPVSVHIDKPPEFLTRRGTLMLNQFAGSDAATLVADRESVVNFRGLREFSDSVPETETTRILPLASGDRGQPSRGVLLDEPTTVPNFGVRKSGVKSVRVAVDDESAELAPSESVTVTGQPRTVSVERSETTEAATVTARPKLRVSNHGVLTAKRFDG